MNRSFLFAPGAGAPSTHAWMQGWRDRLQNLGDVQLFDYDYKREQRNQPDRLPQLIAAHRRALGELREKSDPPVFLIGKSMGARVGCHVSLLENVAGLICLGYPLCGGRDPTKLRDKVLRDLRIPVLFVQGTRDALCPLDLLEKVRGKMTAPNFLHVLEGGDHSLRVLKRFSRAEADARVLDAIAQFVVELQP